MIRFFIYQFSSFSRLLTLFVPASRLDKIPPARQANSPQARIVRFELSFGRLCYSEPDAISNAIGYAKFFSRSHGAVIRVCDAAGNVIETHEHGSGADTRPDVHEVLAVHGGSTDFLDTLSA
jgi:hypothetical protein